jgi:hypothetical protein
VQKNNVYNVLKKIAKFSVKIARIVIIKLTVVVETNKLYFKKNNPLDCTYVPWRVSSKLRRRTNYMFTSRNIAPQIFVKNDGELVQFYSMQ